VLAECKAAAAARLKAIIDEREREALEILEAQAERCGKKPPFNVESVVAEFTSLARSYRCNTIVSDPYGAQWVAQSFRKAGVEHRTSKLNRSELYLESIPFWMRGAVSIPDNHQLIRELRLLERKTSPSGADKVDHPKNGSDDFANALAGAMYLAMKEQRDILADQIVGTWPAKIFDLNTGVQINRDHPPLPGPEGPNAEAQIASLKAQAAEMRAEYPRPDWRACNQLNAAACEDGPRRAA
jgi:hypothetical protein